MAGKILGIGLQRTGTTSIYYALKELGINVAPNAIPLFYDQKDAILSRYESFVDNPIPLIYQQIDQDIPGCKFILTTRSQDAWISSVQWLFENDLKMLNLELQKVANEIHQKFYGTQHFNKATFISSWKAYHKEVLGYFEDRDKDLLVLDIETEIGWGPLCEFLGKKVPKNPFPHINKTLRE